MSTIDSSSSVASSTRSSTASAISQTNSETEERFLTLLLTQLKNQDPLNPMDNAAVTSQMAQLSMVSSLSELNTTLASISGQIDVGQAIDAAALVGKQVLVPGNRIAVGTDADGHPASTTFGIDLEAAASSVKVEILDANGTVVRTLDLGAQAAGVLTPEWDGLNDSGTAVADGAYYAQVQARDASGAAVSATALTSGTVGSVVYTANGLQLDLGLAGQASLFNIYKIM